MTAESDLRELEAVCEEITHHGALSLSRRDYMTTSRGRHVLTVLSRISREIVDVRASLKWEREVSTKLVDALRDDNQRLTDALLEAK